MNNVGKIIKYLAMAFAFFLIFAIIFGIFGGIMALDSIFDKDNNNHKLEDLEIIENANILDIDIVSTNLTIKVGDTFKAETTNKYIECKQSNNRLIIKEKNKGWFNFNNDKSLVVYIPSYMIMDSVNINSSAGKIKIESLSTNKLDLTIGTGILDIDELSVLKKALIEGGAGEILISSGEINDLDLDTGVGKTTINAKLTGDNEIDTGIGALYLNLLGEKENYRIKFDKGIGSIYLEGSPMIDNTIYGNGNTTIDIEGGVGSININFNK